MKPENVQKVLTMFRLAYPISFSKTTPEESQILLNLWCLGLSQYEDAKVNAAAITWICTHDGAFAPTLGQLVSKIKRIPLYEYSHVYPKLFIGCKGTPIGNAKQIADRSQIEYKSYLPDDLESRATPEQIAEVKELQRRIRERNQKNGYGR